MPNIKSLLMQNTMQIQKDFQLSQGFEEKPNVQKNLYQKILNSMKNYIVKKKKSISELFSYFFYFSKIDKDGDGTINRDEMRVFLRDIDLFLSPSEENEIFQEFDRNGNDKICIEEFAKQIKPEITKDGRIST